MANEPIEFPVSDAMTVGALTELFNELMSELTHSGRMDADEARRWDAQLSATLRVSASEIAA